MQGTNTWRNLGLLKASGRGSFPLSELCRPNSSPSHTHPRERVKHCNKNVRKKNLKNVQLARKRLRKRITLKDIKPNLGTCDTDSPFNINNIMETH